MLTSWIADMLPYFAVTLPCLWMGETPAVVNDSALLYPMVSVWSYLGLVVL